MRWFFQYNVIEMYLIHNEGKSVIAEKLITTWKSKLYKYMTSISKNVYIDKWDDIFDKYNNTYHSTIKMKPADVKSNTYIDSTKDTNNKDPNFKISDIVRISKYFLKKATIFICLKKFFWLRKLKILCHGYMLLMALTKKKLFMNKNCKKQIK